MKHNVILQAINPDGSMKTWEYFTIKSFLVAENHRHDEDNYKFHKAVVNGVEFARGDDYPYLMRDVSDFKTYCRQHVDRKEIKSIVPKEILRQFVMHGSKDKKIYIYQSFIQKSRNISDYYANSGGGMCEYRPGYLSGYDCYGGKVKLEWINDDADICIGTVSYTQLLNEIKELINEGIYCDLQQQIKPRIVFYEDGKQLQGQLSITDWLTV